MTQEGQQQQSYDSRAHDALKKELTLSKELIASLQQKNVHYEAKLARFKMRSSQPDLDIRHEKEPDPIRRKPDDKNFEMSGLARKLSSLVAKSKTKQSQVLKESLTHDSRDITPNPIGSVLKQQLTSHKNLYGQDLHMEGAMIRRKSERSKSTERPTGRLSRSKSRSRVNLSSTIRK